jgi:hypothetical protein
VSLSTLDAYALLRFSEDFKQRLFQAEGFLAERRGLSDEKGWMRSALDRLEKVCAEVPSALERAHHLPELASVRDEYAWQFQGIYVDALEKLHAGITFHVSARAPIMEALFPAMKLASLRRAPREQVEKYARELEKRVKGGYVTRMLGTPEFAFLPPVIEQVRAAYAQWESTFAEASLSSDELRALGDKLISTAEAADLAVSQARLLAEAALIPVPGAFEEHGLNAKPKKRGRSMAELADAVVPAESPEEVEALPDEEVLAAETEEAVDEAPVETAPASRKRRAKPPVHA